MWLRKLFWQALGWAFGLPAFGCFLMSGAIVFGQCVQWTKTAIWEGHTIAGELPQWGIPYPYMPNYVGYQKIIDAILSWPASLGYVVFGVGFFTLSFAAVEQLEEIKVTERQAKHLEEEAERARDRKEELQERAAQSKSDFDFAEEVEALLKRRR